MTNTMQLSSSDIAQMAGVGLSTVSNWRSRHDDFPEPVSGSGASPRFDVTEVRAWLKAHGKRIQNLSADSVLWNVMDRWRGSAEIEDVARFVSAMLVWRAVSDPASPRFIAALSEEAQWSNLIQQVGAQGGVLSVLQMGMREYESKSEDNYRPVFEAFLDRTDQFSRPRGESFLENLIQALNSFKSEELGSIYVAFQDRLTQSMHRGYDDHFTSPVLRDLMVAVSKDVPGPVHDPAVGSARLLLAVGSHGENRTQLTGQDSNRDAYIQAIQRALITGHDNVILQHGDIFQTDYFEANSAQVVVLDPPHGHRYPDMDRLALDHRLPYGTPSRINVDLAWVQLALWYLAPQGRAFVLQPESSAFRGRAEAKIRANMLKSGAIEAVVSLPSDVAGAGPMSLPLDLWVLASPGQSADPERILLIDHSEHKKIDADLIAGLLRNWRTQAIEPDDPHAGAFAINDILEKDSILTPKRWIAYEEDTVTVDSVTADIKALQDAVHALDAAGKTDPVALAPAHHIPKLISVAELAKVGSLEVLRARSRAAARGIVQTPNGIQVVHPRWVSREEHEPQKIDPESIQGDPLLTQPGDVVLQNMGDLTARVDHAGGQVLFGSSLQVLRLQDDRLMPEYLAEMLMSAANRRQAMGTRISRVRLEDLQVALVSQADQQRLVTQFKRIRHLQETAQEILKASSNARDALVDGVTSGTIQLK